MRSEYEYYDAGPLRGLAGRKNSMWFPSGCTNETGIHTDAHVQRLRQIQQPQANNPFVNKYSNDQCGKMRHNSFGARKKAKWKAGYRNSHKPLHKDDVLKGTDEKVFVNCASAVDTQSFSHARLVDRDWNGPNDNVWRTRKVAAELIPAVPQGLELSYWSQIDGPLWLGEW
jgi:hypothetical protein